MAAKSKFNIEALKPANVYVYMLNDRSALSLFFSNIITMIIAIADGWSLIMVMWIYWGQSVAIGITNFIRILSLKNFSTEGFRINNRAVEPTKSAQRQTAFFCLFHYGFFHFVYGIFLFTASFDEDINPLYIILCAFMFLINHIYSFFYNREGDSGKKQNLGTVMFFPYARIIPLHITIVFGFLFATGWFGLLFFLSLKTIADLLMHMIEHRAGIIPEEMMPK